jgi:hypothetical protein
VKLIVIQLVKKSHTSCGTVRFEFLGFCSGVVDVFACLGCGVVSLGGDTNHPVTHCCISEEQSPEI